MKNELEKATAKYLRLLIEELESKNINGARFVEQGNKVILLLDKKILSKTNEAILNSMNLVYPNSIISINDETNPFDYEELYENDSNKPNKKVRPYEVYYHSHRTQGISEEYFNKFRFAGIEINTDVIFDKKIQFGYFLEFINAFQEQDVIGYEDLFVIDEETLRRHNHYLKNHCPDANHISLLVTYNEKLVEYSNDLKIADDPYLDKIYLRVLNRGASDINDVYVNLTLERITQNTQEYMKKRTQSDIEDPRDKCINENSKNSQIQIGKSVEEDIEFH